MLGIWKDVKGYEGIYEAGSTGGIRSLDRIVVENSGKERSHKGRLLKSCDPGSGYLMVRLSKNGVVKTRTVHQLVAEAFLNHVPNGFKMVVDHIDNNKLNNSLSNLQIITHRKNSSKDKKGGSSIYDGVHWAKRDLKWVARIVIKGKRKYLGQFTEELEAAKAYGNALSEHLQQGGDS